MYLTWLDSNSWLLELGGTKILIDPWLVGSLVFGNAPWLFKGVRNQPRPVPDNIDVILLTQGLEDHAHPETLQVLDRTIPVVGSPNAAKVVEGFGYQNITALAHGDTTQIGESVEIRALPGSPIGPMLVENAYLISDRTTGATLYYEPHGFHSPQLQDLAPVDVVLTPILDLGLPLVGPIIKGTESALKVAQWLKPQVMLPTASPGDVQYEGFLVSLLRASGNIDEFRQTLQQQNLSTQVLEPTPGDRVEIPLAARVS